MNSAPQFFMWPDRALYLGPSFDPDAHRHHAVQMCVGVNGAFRISLGRGELWHEARGALVGSEVTHQISSQQTAMAFLYLEREFGDYRASLQYISSTEMCVLKADLDASLLESLVNAGQGCTLPDAHQLSDRMLSFFGIQLTVKAAIDPRIARVLAKLDQTPDAQCAGKELESIACLSSSRLQHLFRQQVGVPIRRYSLWLRLRRVLTRAAAGDTLMAAAHTAGFSDSAHFSRVFRTMFGIAPSRLFSTGSAAMVSES